MKSLLFILLLFQMIFAYSQSGELIGAVVDKDGEGIPFARVLVYDLDKLITGSEADFDGQFRISHLMPGEYEVVFCAYFENVDTLRLSEVRVYPERTTSLGEVSMTRTRMEIIGCDFGLELRQPIKLDPFGGSTIVQPEDIRRP